MPGSGKPQAIRTSVHKSTNLPVVAMVAGLWKCPAPLPQADRSSICAQHPPGGRPYKAFQLDRPCQLPWIRPESASGSNDHAGDAAIPAFGRESCSRDETVKWSPCSRLFLILK